MKQDDNNEHLITIYLLIIFLGILLAGLTIKITDRLNELERRVDAMQAAEPIKTITATPTDAIPTPATESKVDTKRKIAYQLKKDFYRALYTTEKISTVEAAEPEMQFAGVYELTAYIDTGNPCADGIYPVVGFTVASNDPTLWHKYILIEGYGKYYVHDRGAMASNVIDVFVSSYDEAMQFGRREANIYILE